MEKIRVIDFSATWCGPCRMQKPIMDEIEKEYSDRVEVVLVDIDESREMTQQYGIQAVPTIVIEVEGDEVARFQGVTSKDRIMNEVKKYE
ncbi:MAG: thioredoxin fold domain-containing protein [Methanosarcinaceae archaeon]|nr:thioredoxin fold domain-containing protein [Methanosarcinaceae archaeon]